MSAANRPSEATRRHFHAAVLKTMRSLHPDVRWTIEKTVTPHDTKTATGRRSAAA